MINDREENYTPDPLNRYEGRTVSGAVDVRGTADADAIILVNDLPAVRTGKDFYRAAEVDNRTSPVNAEIKVQAVRLGPPALVGTEVLAARVETGTLRYAYDKDGNPLGHGLWGYTWDGENRLVAAQISEAVRGSIESLPRYRLEFAYDGFGRRIAKTVKEWNTGSSTWDTIAKTHYLYDGWNLIAELDALGGNTVVRSHVWGIDLSGTPQGAGGVGGLLWSNTSTGTHAPGYDGNGNVIAWIDLGDGTLSGTREYGPFGETLAMTGLAREMPFGFSTKFEDTETKCYYYGYRYYDPSTGRWLGRDPIGERGGVNLYGMVRNNPIGAIDILGLDELTLSYDLAADDSGPIGAKEFSSWTQVLEDAKKRVKDCHCIKLLRVGGHGSPGQFGGGVGGSSGADLTNNTFTNNAAAENKPGLLKFNSFREDHDKIRVLHELKKLMCKGGKIEVIACSLFAGQDGKDLQGNLEGVFGQGNVNGYDFPVVWGFYTGNVYHAYEKPNGNVSHKEKVTCSCETY